MESDRIDRRRTEPPPPAPRRRFEDLFSGRANRRGARPLAPPRRRDPGAKTRSRVPFERNGGPPGTERRTAARREIDDAARQRMTDGVVATTQSTGRLAARNTELLRTALQTEERVRDGRGTSPPVRSGPTGTFPVERPPGGQDFPPVAASAGTTARPASSERTERALALVERIERLVRSGRPALALTLRDGIPGRLEVQRLAPGTISLRLSSPRLPSSTELGALCQALEERGLSVRSLETRGL